MHPEDPFDAVHLAAAREVEAFAQALEGAGALRAAVARRLLLAG